MKKNFLKELVLQQKITRINLLPSNEEASILWRYCEDLIKKFCYNMIFFKYDQDKDFISKLAEEGIISKIIDLQYNNFEMIFKKSIVSKDLFKNLMKYFSDLSHPLNNDDILKFIYVFSDYDQAEILSIEKISKKIYDDRNTLSHTNHRSKAWESYDLTSIEMLENTIWNIMNNFL